MSAPFNVDPAQLRDIAGALDDFASATRRHGVRIDAYGPIELRHAESDTTFRVAWDDEGDTYIISDRIGD